MNKSKRTWLFFQHPRKVTGIAICFLLLFSFPLTTFSQLKVSGVSGRKAANKKFNKRDSNSKPRDKKDKSALKSQDGERKAERMDYAAAALQKTSDEIMAEQAARGEYKTTREIIRDLKFPRNKERPNRQNLPEGPSLPGNRYPLQEGDESLFLNAAPQIAAQTLGLQFNGVIGPAETGAFPPDTEGEIGPTQFVVHVNGRLRTFNKTTGVADGVLNVDTDVFFASVMTTPGAGQTTFSTDPNVRYDRLTNRWFLNIIDVTLTGTGALATQNRIIIAVSDAASNGTITGSTTWTFYQFLGDATLFTDYQSFGIDANAMYIGANMFTIAGSFNSTKGFVIPVAPALTGSPLTVWTFPNMATGTGAGPFSPRGVDNPDPTNTGPTASGYFIGVDNAMFNTLVIRRITNPGSLVAAPTISANLSLTVPATRFPVKVPHLGNTGGNNGRLDALDDRLYSAMMRNGRLWTAHNIGVNNTGVAGATNNRNAARWYEIQNLNVTPSLVQSGTLFDNSANNANQRNYWIPTIAVSGQGHAAIGTSIAGTNEPINAFTTGRLVGDTLGMMREGTGSPASNPGYTASVTAYNPPGDSGGTGGRRWGDYSATVVDPLDDMTMWTLQQYNNGVNTYGVRAVKLIAPPPATPNTASVASGVASINVIITGTQTNGSGFYDPGSDLPAPALPFNHIMANVSGSNVIVNSITYNNPTQVTLNLNTTGAALGDRTLTITNPDGQQTTSTLTISVGPTAASVSVSGRVIDASGRGVPNASVTFTNMQGEQFTAMVSQTGKYHLELLQPGETYVVTIAARRFQFTPQVILVTEDMTELNFTAN